MLGQEARPSSARPNVRATQRAALGQPLERILDRGGNAAGRAHQRMGTHQPSIARWERAPMTMSGQNMKAMAIALGVPAGEVFAAIQEQCEIVIKAAEHEIT